MHGIPSPPMPPHVLERCRYSSKRITAEEQVDSYYEAIRRFISGNQL
jgi:hypothetical protein